MAKTAPPARQSPATMARPFTDERKARERKPPRFRGFLSSPNGLFRSSMERSVQYALLRVRREGCIGYLAAQKLDGFVELDVIHRIRRNIGRRTGSVVLLGIALDVALEFGFAAHDVLTLQFRRQWLVDLDVGRDALALDRLARWRVIERGRQAQRTVFAERNDRLHRALAEGLRAEHGGAAMILKRTGNDFRSTGRTAIDENNDRLAVGQVALARIEARHVLRIAATGRNHLALVEEGVGYGDRLIEQPARIEAKVQHIALELVARNLVLNILDRLLQVIGRLFGKRDDAQIAHIVLDAVANGLHLDDGARDLQRDRLVGAFALNGQLNLRAHFAAHLVHGVAQRQPAPFLPVALADEVACE